MDYVLSVDLGTQGDFTANTLLEMVPKAQEKGKPIYGDKNLTVVNEIHLRFMERLELQTSYVDVVTRIQEIIMKPNLQGRTFLIVDETGVGIPVIQMMRERGLSPIGISITSGSTVNNRDTGYTVPKRDLVSNLQVLFQSRRLKFSKGLKGVENLIHELNNFTAKTTKKDNTTFEAAKESDHDDLVMSLAMGCWFMNRMFGAELNNSSGNDGKTDYDVLNYGIDR